MSIGSVSAPRPATNPPVSPVAANEGFRLGHRRSLDGVRGVAVLLVVLTHLELLPGNCAAYAVNTFFVLSGFLITGILIEEWNASGTIRFRNFYARRALRLLPALFLMLAVLVAYEFLTEPRKLAVGGAVNALQAMFYCTNWAQAFHFSRHSLYGHTWSLSIEEQFYLLWPFLLLWLLRKTSRTSLLWWILLGAVLAVLARAVLLVLDPLTLSGLRRVYLGLDTRADSLLLGGFAAALLSRNLLPHKTGTQTALRWSAPIALALLIGVGCFDMFGMVACLLGWFLASAAAAVILLHLATDSGTWLHRVLETAPLTFLGRISYGLYLWHLPIIQVLQPHGVRGRLWSVPLFLTATLASYYWLERPCLRLKKRFEMRPGS